MHKYPWWQDGQAIWKILVWPRDVCSKTAELGTGRSGKYVQLFINATFRFNNWCSFSSKLVVNWSSLQPYKLWKSHLSPKPQLSPWFILPPPNRPTLYHCPAQRDFAQIFRHQQFCTTTRIPGRDLQKEHLTGRGEVLPKQTHRTAVIHPGSSGNATDLQGYTNTPFRVTFTVIRKKCISF